MKNKKAILVFLCIIICIFTGIKVYNIYYLKNNPWTGGISLEEMERVQNELNDKGIKLK